MTPDQETQLKDLEANTARTPEEEAVRVALLELDERSENLSDAQATLAAAVAAQTPPVPDPLAADKQAVVDAQAAVDTASAALATAEAALPAATPPAPAV